MKINWKRKLCLIALATITGVVLGLTGISIKEVPSYSPALQISIGDKVLVIGDNIAYAAGLSDYTCDGTNDDVQFQLALNALPATGGKIVALAGTYNFGSTVTRAIDDIVIQGVGRATYFQNDGGTALFSVGLQDNWHFRDLATDAGGINTASATFTTKSNVTEGSTYYSFWCSSDIGISSDTLLIVHQADLDAHTKDFREQQIIGEYLTPLPAENDNTTSAISANTIYSGIFIVTRDMTLDRLAIDVTVAGGGGTNARIGIYNGDASLEPTSLLADCGIVDISSTGPKYVDINQALTKGIYFLSVLPEDDVILRRIVPAWSPLGMYSTLTLYNDGYSAPQAYGALPDPHPAPITLGYSKLYIYYMLESLD